MKETKVAEGIAVLDPHPTRVFIDWMYKVVQALRKSGRKREIPSIDVMGPENHEMLVVRFEEGRLGADGMFFDIPIELKMDTIRLLECVDVMLAMAGFGKPKGQKSRS